MKGVFLCSKHVLARAMKPARQGVIIRIASIVGLIGSDRRVYEGCNYGGGTIDCMAAKGGLISMTHEMACTLAQYNIRVNCISPGGFWRGHSERFTRQYTYRIPMGRMEQDGKDLKGAVIFLASEASSYATGINLTIDEGLTTW